VASFPSIQVDLCVKEVDGKESAAACNEGKYAREKTEAKVKGRILS